MTPHRVRHRAGRTRQQSSLWGGRALSFREHEVRSTPWSVGELLEGTGPAQLWVRNHHEGRCFLVMTEHTGAAPVRGLEQSLAGGQADHADSY